MTGEINDNFEVRDKYQGIKLKQRPPRLLSHFVRCSSTTTNRYGKEIRTQNKAHANFLKLIQKITLLELILPEFQNETKRFAVAQFMQKKLKKWLI